MYSVKLNKSRVIWRTNWSGIRDRVALRYHRWSVQILEQKHRNLKNWTDKSYRVALKGPHWSGQMRSQKPKQQQVNKGFAPPLLISLSPKKTNGKNRTLKRMIATNYICLIISIIIACTNNKLAKARKMRKPPGALSLKKFGPGKFWVEKVWAQSIEKDEENWESWRRIEGNLWRKNL